MNKELLYKITLADGTTHENLSYNETFELMVSNEWDYIYFMNPEDYDWRKVSE